jgi:hypothetical protein
MTRPRRMAKMVGFMATDKAAEACAGIIEKTGRECVTCLGPPVKSVSLPVSLVHRIICR